MLPRFAVQVTAVFGGIGDGGGKLLRLAAVEECGRGANETEIGGESVTVAVPSRGVVSLAGGSDGGWLQQGNVQQVRCKDQWR
jgi:hypothetical protein